MGEAGRDDASGLIRLPAENPSICYAVLNQERGVRIAIKVRVAGSSRARRQGLLGSESLDEGSGLWIAPCEAIHTFGMRIPIDVLFLNADFRVLKLICRLRSRRISICLKASSVLELDAGAIARSGTRKGDRLLFEPFPAGLQPPSIPPMRVSSPCT